MIEDKIRDVVKQFKPYVPGKSKEEIARKYGIKPEDIIKLGSNENPWGPSPKIKDEILKEIHFLFKIVLKNIIMILVAGDSKRKTFMAKCQLYLRK